LKEKERKGEKMSREGQKRESREKEGRGMEIKGKKFAIIHHVVNDMIPL
jgi:hypothetical protein